MGKKEPKSSRILLIVAVCSVAVAGWWLWNQPLAANLTDKVTQYIENRDIVTLEARFLPEQIVDIHRSELVDNGKRSLRNTSLHYHPYLLLNVKYPESNKTREGVLLWGLNDGEMVIHTDTWEKTHGFRDCIECKATRNDFKILQSLAKRQGSLSLEDLQSDLRIEREMLHRWIEDAKEKHLVIQKGNLIQLHFENPKLLVSPQTKIKQHLVSKPLGEGKKVGRTFSRSQILAVTRAAFGSDFTIRNEQEIFLPVYSFEILNPDGSVQTSEWNALTGQQIIPHYLTYR